MAVSTWCPLSECEFFGTIAECLRRIGEDAAASLVAIPFDYMPADALEGHFSRCGFRDVSIERLSRNLVFEGGIDQAYAAIFATPVAPSLAGAGRSKLEEFRSHFYAEAGARTQGGVTAGQMASLLLRAVK